MIHPGLVGCERIAVPRVQFTRVKNVAAEQDVPPEIGVGPCTRQDQNEECGDAAPQGEQEDSFERGSI